MKAIGRSLMTLMLLTACSQEHGPGVSADLTDSTSRESKTVLTRGKDLAVGNTTKATVQMPAAGLIADAMRELVRQDNQDVHSLEASFIRGAQYNGWTPMNMPKIDPAGVKDWLAVQAEIDRSLASDPIAPGALEAKRACAEKGSAGDLAGAKACYEAYFHALVAAGVIAVANATESGWPIDPGGKMAGPYLIAMSSLAEFANQLETELAAALQGRALRDPIEAKEQIRATLLSMKPEVIEAIATQARATARTNLAHSTLDLASGKGITWQATDSTYSNMGKGWTVSRNGMTWFGEGRLTGKSYDLALESSVVATMTKRKSLDDSTTSTTSEQQKADVRVK